MAELHPVAMAARKLLHNSLPENQAVDVCDYCLGAIDNESQCIANCEGVRILAYEDKGMTHSDAQAAVQAEDMQKNQTAAHRPGECPFRQRKRGPFHCPACIATLRKEHPSLVCYHEANERVGVDMRVVVGNYNKRKNAEGDMAVKQAAGWLDLKIQGYLYGKYARGWVLSGINPADLPF